MIAENKPIENTRNMPITTIDLDLTNDCVLACDYCFRGEKNKRRLTLDIGKKAIDWFIKESGDQKKLSVALFGGEPLMEFKLIKQLVPYAKQAAKDKGKSIHFSATTNCVLINDEMITFFRKYKMSFHTSVDGGPESHDKHRHFADGRGSFAIIEPKLKKVLKYWPNRTARMTLSNDNVERWLDDAKYMVELGYTNLAMIPVPEQEWTPGQWETAKQQLREISDYYIEQYRKGAPLYIKHIDDAIKGVIKPSRRKAHCGAGRGYVLIKTDGTIYPCHRFGGDIDAESQKQWILGTIFDGWDGDKRGELLSFDCRKHVKADCENCIAVHTCGTTCIAVSWSCFGDIYTPHPNQCRFTKMYFEEAMRVHYILDCENNHTFIKKYHPERLRKNSKNANQRRNRPQSRQRTAIPKTVFVMLSSEALSPCFMFNGKHHKTKVRLSVEKLKAIMKWATRENTSPPHLFFLVDDTEKLDAPIAKFLENIPEQILVPLVSREQQNKLQMPFSEDQAVIAANLTQLVAEKESIANRPVIAHVEHSEIEKMTDLLVSIKDRIPQITLRLRNAHELNNDQIGLYEKQLDMLRDVLRLESFLSLNGIRRIHLNGASNQHHCPAGRQLITIGPDGLVYPCPTFYLSGSNGRSLDSVKGSNGSPFSIVDTEPGCICNSEKCPGCEFLKLSGDEISKQICNVYKAELVMHA